MSLETVAENHTGPAPDRDEIIRVVRRYVEAFGAHDPAMFREVFHPSARIAFTYPDGHLQEGLIYDDAESWASGSRASDRILAVIQAGDVATVLLGFDGEDPGQEWVDIHALLRIDGAWKIMSKTATHASRADWAGKAPPAATTS